MAWNGDQFDREGASIVRAIGYIRPMSRYDREMDRKRFLKMAGIVLLFVAIIAGFLWAAQQQAAPINNPGASAI